MSNYHDEIALKNLSISQITLVATIMNLDTNLRILEENKRYHIKSENDQLRITTLLTDIAETLKNK